MQLPLQLLLLHAAAALDDGLCRTPIMGMNSWTAFGASVTEADLLSVGRFFVTSGLREKGCLSPANIDRLSVRVHLPSAASVCQPACLPACLPALILPACLPACLRGCLRECLREWLSACLSVCVRAWVRAWVRGCLPACLRACLPASLPACLSACLFLWFTYILYGAGTSGSTQTMDGIPTLAEPTAGALLTPSFPVSASDFPLSLSLSLLRAPRLQPDLQKFPDGIRGLTQKLAAMNLSFGIYTAESSVVCSGRPGTLFQEYLLRATPI